MGWAPRVAIGIAVVAVLLYPYEPAREAFAKSMQALRALADSSDRPAAQPPAQVDAAQGDAPAETVPVARSLPLAPELAERLLQSAASLVSSPLREVVDLGREGMDAEIGPDGRVLLTSKYRILSLAAGDASDRRTLFSPDLYREQFSQARVRAMASAVALPEERYLLGGWHGEVLLWSEGRLQRLSGREDRPRGRIADLRRWGDGVLIAGDGLWRLDPEQLVLQELALPTRRRLGALGVRGDELLVAEDGPQVYRWSTAGFEPWLTLPRARHRVEALAAAADGGWWVGSTGGLLRVDTGGRAQEPLLDGIWVSAVLERPDELWVGSWKQGLLLRRDGRWYRLPEGFGGLAAASVSGLAVDAADQIWLTLYGGGAWHATRAALREALMKHPWTPVADTRR